VFTASVDVLKINMNVPSFTPPVVDALTQEGQPPLGCRTVHET
jgi:hypothetical protein